MRKSSTLKDEEFTQLMERMHSLEQPANVTKRKVIASNYMTPHACSAIVVTGGHDPRSLSKEAKDWMRDVKPSSEMEDSFWTKKAPTKNNLWNEVEAPVQKEMDTR